VSHQVVTNEISPDPRVPYWSVGVVVYCLYDGKGMPKEYRQVHPSAMMLVGRGKSCYWQRGDDL